MKRWWPPSVKGRIDELFQNTLFRYLFAFVVVTTTYAIRLWLVPLTGTGAPYVLTFAAVLAISLFAGVGPGICAVLLSVPLGAEIFVVRAGYPPFQAAVQALLFAVDGFVAVYLTFLVDKGRRSLQDANQRLRDANDEITRSVERSKDVIELAPDAFFLADLDGHFSDVNQEACRMLGYAREELVGKAFTDLLSPEDAPLLPTRKELAPGRVHRAEWRLLRRDGGVLPVEVSACTLPDGRWQAFMRDISERKRVEDERQVFVSLLENSSDFIGIADPGGKPVYLNPAGRRMVGLGADLPLDQIRIQDCYPPALRSFAVDVIVKSTLEQGRWSGETYFRNWRTEEAIPVSDEHFMIRDPKSGRVLGMGTVTRDISEARRIAQEREQLLAGEQRARQQAEATNERLRESEERFRLTLDEAPIGMALVALDGRFVRVNRALCELVGYGPDELTSMTFQTVTHPDDLQTDLALAGRLARGEIPSYELEKRYLRKDGTVVDITLSASILRDRDGSPRYYIAQMEDITERKRAEQALRRSEAQFRGLIERMPDGVFVNQGGRVVYANEAMATLLGYDDRAALVGHPILELFHPDDRPIVLERITVLQKTGLGVRPRELRMICRNGEHCSVETVALTVQFEGEPGIVVVVRDLTERKQVEQALRMSEAKFSGIVSISADAIISIDDEQRITIFNDGAEKIFGYSKAEAIGAPLDLLFPERFRQGHRRHIERFAAGQVAARRMGERLTTIAGRRKSGEEFPAEAAISRLKVGDKTLLTVALRDMTERKRVEKEQQFLADAGAVLAATLDYEQTLATVARLVVRDFADWCIVDIVGDDEHLRRLKVASADPAKASLCELLERMPLDRDRPHLTRPVIETRRPLLIETVTSQRLESFAQGPDHLQLLRALDPLSLMALPLLMRGQLLGALVFISSTPSRLYGRSDLRLAEALADRAALAIENARLYRASVQATQLRDQVLGIVAHDLRNPLNTILMQASALQRQGAEPERRSQRPREIIRRAATRMNRLIQDLLDVARMEAGQLTIAPARLAADELIVEAVELQRPLAASSSLELRLELQGDLAEVWGDRDRLLQVFENLIGNAIKFTDADGRITVGAVASDREVVFSVADTGCGIAPESVPRIFDRFWQAAGGGRLGAGLGLPITKGIVEAHGGRIWVESTPGRGSTFFFSIPKAAPGHDRPADVLH